MAHIDDLVTSAELSINRAEDIADVNTSSIELASEDDEVDEEDEEDDEDDDEEDNDDENTVYAVNSSKKTSSLTQLVQTAMAAKARQATIHVAANDAIIKVSSSATSVPMHCSAYDLNAYVHLKIICTKLAFLQ